MASTSTRKFVCEIFELSSTSPELNSATIDLDQIVNDYEDDWTELEFYEFEDSITAFIKKYEPNYCPRENRDIFNKVYEFVEKAFYSR